MLWLISSRAMRTASVCAAARSGRHDPSGSRMRWTPSRTWKKNSGIPVAPRRLRIRGSGRSAPPHTRLEQPTERGRFPRHARISPVFAGCVPATSVPRNSDHRREAAAGGDGSGTIFPPVTRRRCGTVASTRRHNGQPDSEFPVSDIKSQYAYVRCFLVPGPNAATRTTASAASPRNPMNSGRVIRPSRNLRTPDSHGSSYATARQLMRRLA